MLTGRLSGGSWVTSWPRSRMRPPVGSSKPPIMRSVVVLPQPDGPSSEKNSPAPTSSETPSTARTSRKRFSRSSSWISADDGTGGDVIVRKASRGCRSLLALVPVNATWARGRPKYRPRTTTGPCARRDARTYGRGQREFRSAIGYPTSLPQPVRGRIRGHDACRRVHGLVPGRGPGRHLPRQREPDGAVGVARYGHHRDDLHVLGQVPGQPSPRRRTGSVSTSRPASCGA